MKLEFTTHVQARLLSLPVSTEKIKEVIRQPDLTKTSADGTIVSERRFEDGVIRVVYDMRRQLHIIISAYYLT